MKFNQVLTQTFEHFVTTAKGTSEEWIKFAMENPLTQEVKTRYPDSLKRGAEFVDEQSKQVRKLMKLSAAKRFAEKRAKETTQNKPETTSNAE